MLRTDIDDDLVAFIYETAQFLLMLYIKGFDIKEQELMIKLQEYLMNFLRHGILKDSESPV